MNRNATMLGNVPYASGPATGLSTSLTLVAAMLVSTHTPSPKVLYTMTTTVSTSFDSTHQ
jgi:hypothetical protein